GARAVLRKTDAVSAVSRAARAVLRLSGPTRLSHEELRRLLLQRLGRAVVRGSVALTRRRRRPDPLAGRRRPRGHHPPLPDPVVQLLQILGRRRRPLPGPTVVPRSIATRDPFSKESDPSLRSGWQRPEGVATCRRPSFRSSGRRSGEAPS